MTTSSIEKFYEMLAVEAATELREKSQGLAREVRLTHVEQAMGGAELIPEDLAEVDMPFFVSHHLRPALRHAMTQIIEETSWAVEHGIDDVIRDH